MGWFRSLRSSQSVAMLVDKECCCFFFFFFGFVKSLSTLRWLSLLKFFHSALTTIIVLNYTFFLNCFWFPRVCSVFDIYLFGCVLCEIGTHTFPNQQDSLFICRWQVRALQLWCGYLNSAEDTSPFPFVLVSGRSVDHGCPLSVGVKAAFVAAQIPGQPGPCTTALMFKNPGSWLPKGNIKQKQS